jgi:hypothetical protein
MCHLLLPHTIITLPFYNIARVSFHPSILGPNIKMGENSFWVKWEGAMWEKGQVVIGRNGDRAKWSLGKMKKLGRWLLGEMKNGQKKDWTKWSMGKIDIGQNGKRANWERAKWDWAKWE